MQADAFAYRLAGGLQLAARPGVAEDAALMRIDSSSGTALALRMLKVRA
jgi:hypothetical protein